MLAQIFGIGAMISLFLIYQQKSRKKMLLCKLSADLFWIAHYFCLGAAAGMIPNFVGVFRELVFLNRKTKRWASSPAWVVMFIALNVSLGMASFQSWYDMIPIIASSFVTISLWIDAPRLTKGISLPVSACFLTYDSFVGSYIGMLNESLSILSILFDFFKTYAKHTKEERHHES